MLISMDILAHELKDYVAFLQLRPNTKLEISSCQMLDESAPEFRKEFVYLVLPQFYHILDALPEGTNVMCVGPVPEQSERYRSLNLMTISDISFIKAINAVNDIFQKYNELGSKLDSSFQSGRLKTILNAAADLLQVPVNMIDMNHSLLAYSTNLRPTGDVLWDAIAEGYGYEHYSIVSSSQPKLPDMDEKGQRVYEGVSNISHRYIRVYLLRRGTKGIAAFGLHKHVDCDKPFARHTVQLADYIVERMNSQLNMFSEITFARGKLYERFLVDLLDGKPYDPQSIEATMKSLSVEIAPQYLLGLVLFQNPTMQTDYHFALMNYIEALMPHCKCAMHKSRIVVLYPQTKSGFLSKQLETDIAEFLNKHDCFFLLSSPFSSLLELSGIEKALEAVIPYVSPSSATPQVYHYSQFAELHALHLLSQELPLTSACHPLLSELLQHDRDNNSDYYQTLVAYLRSSCNITEAAKTLQIHRNSLLYRINKIETILGSKLDDSALKEQLLFSIHCLEFDKRYGGNFTAPNENPSMI